MASFPNTFLWGSSTNAQQFEGGRDEGGAGVSIADVRVIPGYKDADFSGFKVAADHYHHLEEDLDLYAGMGFTTYRFSMAWTRIFPQGDDAEPNAEGLAFYDRMVDGLIARNIVPICTLYAYDLPQHLVDKYGGWGDRQIVDDYVRYVETVVEHFKGRIKYYVPFNEYNCIWLDRAYMTGTPVENDTDMLKVIHHMTMGYAHACEIVHSVDPEAKVGGNIANNIAYPASPNPLDVQECEKHKYFMGWGFTDIECRGAYPKYFLNRFDVSQETIDAIITAEDKAYMARHIRPDFISLTYYFTTVIAQNEAGKNAMSTGHVNPFCDHTEWGWSIEPYGFYLMLMEYWHRYQLPILILENGLGHRDVLVGEDGEPRVHDQNRIDFLRNHIRWMDKAVSDGVEMVGYCTWAAIDLYSTREGFGKRYGFVYVDADHGFRRIKKDSYAWYAKVIASNGADLAD